MPISAIWQIGKKFYLKLKIKARWRNNKRGARKFGRNSRSIITPKTDVDDLLMLLMTLQPACLLRLKQKLSAQLFKAGFTFDNSTVMHINVLVISYQRFDNFPLSMH